MNKKGFTLVELVVVMVIVGILSVVSVPIYRSYVQRALFTEADTLMSSIRVGQAAYYATNGKFVAVGNTSNSKSLRVDAHTNKYFTSFQISTSESNVPGQYLWEATSIGRTGSNDMAKGLTAKGRGSNYGELNVTLYINGEQLEVH